MSGRGSSSSTTHQQPSAQKEKQRRDRMKQLYSTLAALLHLQPSELRMPLPELLDRATTSLEELKERVEELKGRKKEVEKELGSSEGIRLQQQQQQQMVQVRESAEDLEVNLIIMAAEDNKILVVAYEVLRIIEEGGAQLTSSSFSTLGDLIYCTVHAQAFQARVGFDAAQIQSQLLKLIY